MFPTYLEIRTMDKVHKPSDSECYMPSSEAFGFYRHESINTLLRIKHLSTSLAFDCGLLPVNLLDVIENSSNKIIKTRTNGDVPL
jgi:hypothetical protein